jgi:cytochrome b6
LDDWSYSCFSYSFFGVTGYSLPWDQIGYWACKIVTGVPDAVPVVGSTIVELLRGGTSGQGTLTRFYSLHTFVLPLITAVLMHTLNDQKTRYFRTIINQILSHYEILFK